MAKCKDHPLNVPIVEEHITDNIRVHGLLIVLSASATVVACCTSAYLIFRHASNYTKPKEQKQIIRILLMVPIYTIACTLCIPFYKENAYIGSIYEFYESLVIASFFLLLCQLLHPDLETLRRVFHLVEPKPWIHPIRFLVVHVGRNKKGRTSDGLRWFNIIWLGVFQFCVVKFLGALTKCITEALDVYCEDSKSPSHAKLWVMIIEVVSLVTAMLCLLQFYNQTKQELNRHRPLLKFLAIKLVVFLFYVQTYLFDFLLREGGPVKPSATISYPSWAVGIPNTILCFEMAAVSILHLWAYPYDVYRACASTKTASSNDEQESQSSDQYPMDEAATAQSREAWPPCPGATQGGDIWDGTTSPHAPNGQANNVGVFQWRAFVDAFKFIDLAQAVVKAARWLLVERRGVPGSPDGGEDVQRSDGSVIEFMGQSKTSDLSQALLMAENRTVHV